MIENEYLILRNKKLLFIIRIKKETSTKMYKPFLIGFN